MTTAEWKRPEAVHFPQVWLRCEGKKPMSNGKIPKFRVQDLPEELFDEVIHLMTTMFLKEELMCKVAGVSEDPESVQDFVGLWRKILPQRAAVVALTETEGEPTRIAGVNITSVSLKTDELSADAFKGKAARDVMGFVLNYAYKDINIFEMYGVDAYMSAVGLFVHPDFRGQGVSEFLLKGRFPLARALGLKATMTSFSPYAAFKAAQKAGMSLIKEAVYEDYKKDGKVVFPITDPRGLKVMAAAVS